MTDNLRYLINTLKTQEIKWNNLSLSTRIMNNWNAASRNRLDGCDPKGFIFKGVQEIL